MSSSLYLDEPSLSLIDPIDESTNLLTKTEPSSSPKNDDILNRARRILYASHCFNQFSEQTWQFCLVLILAAVSNYQSLFLVTSYGLVSYLAVCVAGSPLGRFLDETSQNRLAVAQRLILLQNCSVLGATGLCYILLRTLSNDNNGSSSHSHTWKGEIPTDVLSILLLAGIHILGSMAAILDSGFTVAVERDWIVVMSQSAQKSTTEKEVTKKKIVATENDDNAKLQLHEEQKKWLSDTNVSMRQIDLSCKIIAPAVAGVFVAWFDDGSGGSGATPMESDDMIISLDHGYDLRGAALLVGGLNSLALIVEYVGMAKVYSYIPDLARTSSSNSSSVSVGDLADTELPQVADQVPRQPPIYNVQDDGAGTTLKKHRSWWIQFLPDAYQVYFDQHPICWAGFSLSLLYLNVVLTFGGIMTAYLVWLGMGMSSIGFWRGMASAAGLAGTVFYHCISTRMGCLVDVGMVSISYQFLCLSACYASFFMEDVGASLVALNAGVILSRPGLWAFDIAVTQLMQEHVPAPIRGLVGGVQQSMNAFFTLVAFSIGLFLSDPKYFHVYAGTAYSGVGLAVVFYAYNFYPRSKHQ